MMEKHPLLQGCFLLGFTITELRDVLFRGPLRTSGKKIEERRRSLLPVQLADFPFMLERFA